MIQETYGVVIAGGSVIAMARVEAIDATPIDPTTIASVRYSIRERDPCAGADGAPVSGHSDEPLVTSTVVYDTLQTDAAWDADALGYNFRHEIDTTISTAFANAGKTYTVRYELTPTSGQPILFRFQIEAI